MAPPSIMGRSQGLFPEDSLARQRTQRRQDAWSRMFGDRLGAMPPGGAGMGVETPWQRAPAAAGMGMVSSPPISSSPLTSRPPAAPQVSQEQAILGLIGRIQGVRDRWQSRKSEFAPPQQGGIGGVPAMTPEESAFMQRRNAYPSQPGTSQMYDRFGGGPLTGASMQGIAPSAFNNDYDGQVRMQVGGYGSPLSGPLGESRDPEFSDKAVAGRQAERRMRILADQGEDGSSPRLRAARQEIDARRQSMGLRRSDDLQGRIADRDASRTERLQRSQAQNLSRRGISPLSAEGQSLAPGLYGSLRAQRSGALSAGTGSPLTTMDGTPVKPVEQGSPVSPTVSTGARVAAHAMLMQRPLFKALGINAGESPEDMPDTASLVTQFDSALDSSGMSLNDQELQQLHEFAVQAAHTSEDAFAPGWNPRTSSVNTNRSLGLWRELSQIPLEDGTARSQWWQKYQQRERSFEMPEWSRHIIPGWRA
jgi:hypothetical protein